MSGPPQQRTGSQGDFGMKLKLGAKMEARDNAILDQMGKLLELVRWRRDVGSGPSGGGLMKGPEPISNGNSTVPLKDRRRRWCQVGEDDK